MQDIVSKDTKTFEVLGRKERDGATKTAVIDNVLYVPLIGKYGWKDL